MRSIIFLVVRMVIDPRIPVIVKVLLVLALTYSFLPKTWLPFGFLDNILVPLGAFGIFFLVVPWSVIRNHWKSVMGGRSPNDQNDKVVEATYRFLDDEEKL